MKRSDISVVKNPTRPVSFTASCPLCSHTEEAISHGRTKKDKPEMERVAENVARSNIVVHLRTAHKITVE